MSDKSFPERLFDAGFTDLISVIPPGAQLMPSSKVAQAAVGKIPGRRHASGLWAGYDWRKSEATIDDVRRWALDGANVGLRATNFPGVDLDISDGGLAAMIETAVLARLGPAAVRVGKAPKRLLMYSLAGEPFSRMRLWITAHDGVKHLIEVLGEGQQYLVYGVHPNTGLPYQWLQDPTTFDEATITREQASEMLDYIEAIIDATGLYTTGREGDGRRSTRTAETDQSGLLAPSVEALRDCVAAIPNASANFPDRTSYIRMAYAIRAAVGIEHDEEGFEIFADWSARWDDGTNNPETVREDWVRCTGEKSVGWNFLAQLARGFGYVDVAEEFGVVSEAPGVPTSDEVSAPEYSDQDLAEIIIARNRGVLRYVPQKCVWLVWDGVRWVIDAELQAEDLILRGLKQIALDVLKVGVTPKEKRESADLAGRICSAGKATAVTQVIRSSRSIIVSMEALDHSIWHLNTPGGIVDLVTGKLNLAEPDALCTKATIVPPNDAGGAPEWKRFIAEATGGDQDLEEYLQRLSGYILTGSTREEHLSFLFGSGGNGKSVFVNALSEILGDYARTADMSTFTAGYGEKHTTDLAMLVGARLVTANESTAGKRWDDQRIKSLTGGEKVTARFMRMDNFSYRPQFKLLFSGNHQPELRDVGEAMQRRIHMVPFTQTPAVVDRELSDKLREEYPAILAWMIDGCLAWQRDGLSPPKTVTAATDEYFENEDAYGKWIDECVTYQGAGFAETTSDLFQSWQEWANPRKEFVGSMKRLSSALIARKWKRWQETGSRRMGFKGVQINRRVGFEALT